MNPRTRRLRKQRRRHRKKAWGARRLGMAMGRAMKEMLSQQGIAHRILRVEPVRRSGKDET